MTRPRGISYEMYIIEMDHRILGFEQMIHNLTGILYWYNLSQNVPYIGPESVEYLKDIYFRKRLTLSTFSEFQISTSTRKINIY